MFRIESKIAGIIFLAALALVSCTAPRTMLSSGKVVPKNQVRFGKNNTFNIASSPIEQSVRGSYNLANNLSKYDTIILDQQIEHINAAFIAYCLDPIGYSTEKYFRMGIGHNMDMGYKNVGRSHAVDVMYQFLGSTKNFNESNEGGTYGSIGIQYSWEDYKMANYYKFEKLQKLFGVEMWRKDITIPLIFSKSFGPEERVGCLSYGLVYSHSFVKYKISTKDIYYLKENSGIPPSLLTPVNSKINFGAYGAFINVKVGKKYVYFNFSLAAYYQNYGKYDLLGGGSIQLKGISIVPSYGIQFNILPKTKKKVGTEV